MVSWFWWDCWKILVPAMNSLISFVNSRSLATLWSCINRNEAVNKGLSAVCTLQSLLAQMQEILCVVWTLCTCNIEQTSVLKLQILFTYWRSNEVWILQRNYIVGTCYESGGKDPRTQNSAIDWTAYTSYVCFPACLFVRSRCSIKTTEWIQLTLACAETSHDL